MRSATLALSLLSLPIAQASRAGDEPTLESLLQLNGAAIFGGLARLEAGDRLVISLTKPGQFEKCFTSVGKPAMVNPESLKGDLNRKILVNPTPDVGGDIPNQVVVGRGDGEWQSRFEFSGDVEVRFNLRVPALQNGSRLQLRLNQTAKGMLQTGSFFQGAALISGKKAVKQAQPSKEYQGPPEKWFDTKGIVTIAAVLSKETFSLKMTGKVAKGAGAPKDAKGAPKDAKGAPKGAKGAPKDAKGEPKDAKDEPKDAKEAPKDAKEVNEVEMAVLEDVPSSGGKIGFGFNKLTFLISDMTIAGKVDREWLKGQLDELKAKGKLVEKEPPKEPEPPLLRQPKKEAPADGKKEEEEDL